MDGQAKRLWNTRKAGAGAVLLILALVILRQFSGHQGSAPPAPVIALPARDVAWKAALWAKVLTPDQALLRRPEYLLNEPSFLEPLDAKLNEMYLELGHEPATDGERDAFHKALLAAYQEACHGETGLSLLEEKVRQKFEAPATSEDKAQQTVLVDYGVVPGKITSTDNGGYRVETSEMLDDSRHPQSKLVGEMLQSLVQKFPDAQEIVVRMCPLQDPSGRFCEYQYHRQADEEKPGTGLLTASPAADRSSPFYKEWTHLVQDDDFSRWTRDGYALHESLRDQAEDPLAGALLEMGLRTVLVIHAPATTALPVWRPDGKVLAVSTGTGKWQSNSLQQVPRLFTRQWQGQTLAVWPSGQVDSSQLALKVADWERETASGQRDSSKVTAKDGTSYLLREEGGSHSVIRIKPDGTEEKALPLGQAVCHGLALSPNGQWLALTVKELGVVVFQTSPVTPLLKR